MHYYSNRNKIKNDDDSLDLDLKTNVMKMTKIQSDPIG